MRKDEIVIGKHYAVRHNQRTIIVKVEAAPTGRNRRFICKSMKTGRAVRIDPVNFKRETPLGLHNKPDLRSPEQQAFENEYNEYLTRFGKNAAERCEQSEPMTRDEFRKNLEEQQQLCETDR